MTAPPLHDAADGAAPDQVTPEAPRGDVPRELCDLPAAGEAGEEHARGAGTYAAAAILAQHEELADLSHAMAGEVRAIGDQREAGQPSVYPNDEVMPPAARPEPPMPGSRAERAVSLHAPAIATEVVDIELHKVAHRREILPTQGTKTYFHVPKQLLVESLNPLEAALPLCCVSKSSKEGHYSRAGFLEFPRALC